jgi:ribonuclease BN (tRNA processing enzyme)
VIAAPRSSTETLRATVLGSSCAVPRPARACSSYLLEGGGSRVILDFGTGAFANAQEYLRAEEVDAIVISHMHADHFLDLIPLRYALKYGPRTNDRRVALYLPPGGEAVLRGISDALSREPGGDFLGEVFDVATYEPERTLRIGPAQLRFAHTRHYIPAFACRYELGGASVVYSADTAPSEKVVALARGSDLFICEATLCEHHSESSTGRGHLTAREAALMARKAGVARLTLTHYPSESTSQDLAGAVRGVFEGEFAIADDHEAYRVGG